MSGDLGYSVLDASASGQVELDPARTFPITGSDDDVSPLVGGAIALEIPMDEALPGNWTGRMRLPDWKMRVELESTGLREYEIRTRPINMNSGPVYSKVESWTLMNNYWLGVPLRGLYRPISWSSSRLFGRWRLRGLKLALDRTTLEMGVGVGVASIEASSTIEGTSGGSDDYNFAWQAGAGLGYQLTDSVSVSLGYRYIDPGTTSYRLTDDGVPSGSNSKIELDTEIHEARASLRIGLHNFPSPWR